MKKVMGGKALFLVVAVVVVAFLSVSVGMSKSNVSPATARTWERVEASARIGGDTMNALAEKADPASFAYVCEKLGGSYTAAEFWNEYLRFDPDFVSEFKAAGVLMTTEPIPETEFGGK